MLNRNKLRQKTYDLLLKGRKLHKNHVLTQFDFFFNLNINWREDYYDDIFYTSLFPEKKEDALASYFHTSNNKL